LLETSASVLGIHVFFGPEYGASRFLETSLRVYPICVASYPTWP